MLVELEEVKHTLKETKCFDGMPLDVWGWIETAIFLRDTEKIEVFLNTLVTLNIKNRLTELEINEEIRAKMIESATNDTEKIDPTCIFYENQ